MANGSSRMIDSASGGTARRPAFSGSLPFLAVGKSVLSRALVDEYRLSTSVNNSTVCHFFFKNGDERRISSTSALCAILHQLFTYDPTRSLIKCALSSHRDYGETLAQNFSELWRILLKCARSPDAGEIVCILDALDECNEDGQQQLVSQLKDFFSKQDSIPSKLKFLVTSRPYYDLETYFAKFSAVATYMHFDGDDKSEQIGQDINLVIDNRLIGITPGFTDQDRCTIRDHLKNMKNRTYLWLYLTFDIIEHNRSEYARPSDVKQLLSELPSKVSDAYEKILSRSVSRYRTEILLRIVLAAAQPLTLDEANAALTLALQKSRFPSNAKLKADMWPTDNFRSVVTNLCGLFISVHGSRLSFIHQTAREFLTDSRQQRTWQGRFNIQESHSTLSLVCLHYLMLPDIDMDLFYQCSFFLYGLLPTGRLIICHSKPPFPTNPERTLVRSAI